jgi:hypothetical protein
MVINMNEERIGALNGERQWNIALNTLCDNLRLFCA